MRRRLLIAAVVVAMMAKAANDEALTLETMQAELAAMLVYAASSMMVSKMREPKRMYRLDRCWFDEFVKDPDRWPEDRFKQHFRVSGGRATLAAAPGSQLPAVGGRPPAGRSLRDRHHLKRPKVVHHSHGLSLRMMKGELWRADSQVTRMKREDDLRG